MCNHHKVDSCSYNSIFWSVILFYQHLMLWTFLKSVPLITYIITVINGSKQRLLFFHFLLTLIRQKKCSLCLPRKGKVRCFKDFPMAENCCKLSYNIYKLLFSHQPLFFLSFEITKKKKVCPYEFPVVENLPMVTKCRHRRLLPKMRNKRLLTENVTIFFLIAFLIILRLCEMSTIHHTGEWGDTIDTIMY